MRRTSFPIAPIALALAIATSTPGAHAQPLQAGDIIAPGNHVIDGFGNVNGCFYRIRGGEVAMLFESPQYRFPSDMVVDDQGRLVFFASPQSRNSYDAALFRIDPATGALERLWYFPAYVDPADSLPEGASGVTQFGYPHRQSLHLERSFAVRIADDENGGWPQVSLGKSYGFSMSSLIGSGDGPKTFRFRPDVGTCEVGVPAEFVSGTPVYMAADGDAIYYGLNNYVAQTGAPARLSLELDGDWGSFSASISLQPKTELVLGGHVYDDTRYPNGIADCGGLHDDNVPYTVDGNSFTVLDMSGLGVLGGRLYATSSSVATGVPYVFDLAPRAPYLNPYLCGWDTAIQGYGPLDFWLQDGTPTGSSTTSPDGSGLLGQAGSTIKRVTSTGDYQVVDASQPYSGRPWRWSGSTNDPGNGPLDSAQVLVLRTDAVASPLLAAPDGRSIGFDSLGTAVNQFGDAGSVVQGASGWPRVISLRDPPSGFYAAKMFETVAGSWSATAHLAHEGGATARASTGGTAAGVESELRGLYVAQPNLLAWYPSPTGVGDAAAGAGLVSVGPLPARGHVSFAFNVPPGGGRVRLDVFDLAGRRLATPLDAQVPGGLQTLRWGGVGMDGRRLAPGVYLARFDLDGRHETRRVVLVP